MLCGHYKGIDQRIRDHVITLELSIGDYVLSGGIGRSRPGRRHRPPRSGRHRRWRERPDRQFPDGLLAPPVYTRPAEWNGHAVPEVLLGGHHAEIDQWRMEQAVERTKRLRPDLLDEA